MISLDKQKKKDKKDRKEKLKDETKNLFSCESPEALNVDQPQAHNSVTV